MIKVLSLFSGIGAFEKALQRQKIKYELYRYCEIDKYASKGYSIVHNISEEMNLGDITKIEIDKLPNDIDLITHGSPCQSFSIAGKNDGGDKGSGTRSSLMWYTVDIVEHCKPKFVIWENVKNLLSQKHKHNFDSYIEVMKQLGYNSYYKVLNAKDYEIPQSRERVYTISIRQDIDKGFEFPNKQPLLYRLKDMLEEKVEEKYYLSGENITKLQNQSEIKEGAIIGGMQKHQSKKMDGIVPTLTSSMGTGGGYVPMITEKLENRATAENDIAPTLYARDYKDPKCVILTQLSMFNEQPSVPTIEPKRIGGLYDTEKSTHQAGSIWDKEEISPTLDTMQGGHRQPYITESIVYDDYNSRIRADQSTIGTITQNTGNSALRTGYKIIEPVCLNSKGGRGGVDGLQPSLQDRVYDSNYISTAVTTSYMPSITEQYRIRKLTPKETWRLMDFNDEDIDKCIYAGLSNTQLYKMAGNSIVVRVLEYIYKQLGQVYDEFKGE